MDGPAVVSGYSSASLFWSFYLVKNRIRLVVSYFFRFGTKSAESLFFEGVEEE